MHGELPALPLPHFCPAPSLAQLCPLLALLFRTQVSMKALAGKMRWVNRGRGKEGSIEVCSTVPEAGRGMPYALAHTELGIGFQTAPWWFSGCSSAPGICTLISAGCQPLGIPVGHKAMPPCQGVAGLCGFSDTPGALRGQLQPQGRVFLLPQPCPFPVVFSHSFSAFLPLHD